MVVHKLHFKADIFQSRTKNKGTAVQHKITLCEDKRSQDAEWKKQLNFQCFVPKYVKNQTITLIIMIIIILIHSNPSKDLSQSSVTLFLFFWSVSVDFLRFYWSADGDVAPNFQSERWQWFRGCSEDSVWRVCHFVLFSFFLSIGSPSRWACSRQKSVLALIINKRFTDREPEGFTLFRNFTEAFILFLLSRV